MKNVAVFLAEGFEEIEALTVVDVLRRAGENCVMVTLDSLIVKGAHNIIVHGDKIICDEIKDYDLVVFPGGMPGSINLKENEKVIEIVKYFNDNNKLIAAICAAPIVLGRANVIKNKNITSYPGFEDELKEATYIEEENVVLDSNIITSRGPATAIEFSFKILEALGNDSYKDLSRAMMYDFLLENK